MRINKIFVFSIIIGSILATSITLKFLSKFNSDNIDYVIELDKFNISNNNTNAKETTEGINQALEYAKNKGYKTVKLPEGHYAIDTSVISPIVLSDGENQWTHNRKGIIMQSDMELIMKNSVLEMLPTDDPYYSIFTISNCSNSKIIGGTILGDRKEHNFGMRINNNGDELESGAINEDTGILVEDNTKVRTKGFIDNFNGEKLPEEFILSVLEKTTKNTVDGGTRYIYCYDENEKYLGLALGGVSFLDKATLLPNTTKIKVSFGDENRLDAVYYITTELVYPTHEFGSGITIAASNNITIEGVEVKDTIGDCILTLSTPLKVKVDNLTLMNCTLENSRRQGISLVATGENYLIKGCNIGNINGVDPQSGIDIEHYDYVKNVVIDGCNFYDNRKWDFINYNGENIEIKNSKFTGGIASTFGYNMNINNNIFEYKEVENNNKIHQGTLFSLNTNKIDDNNAYFKIYNNYINGYEKAGNTSSLRLSEFNNNKIVDTKNLVIQCNTKNNIFENSKVRYSIEIVNNEKFINSIVAIDNDKYNIKINECIFEESQFMPRAETTIINSTIINKEKSFGETSAWWSLDRRVIFENCNITTEYEGDTQFLTNYQAICKFKNCNLNLSRSLFSLNYGIIKFEECNIKFNEFYSDDKITNFDEIVYGNENNYWEFNNCKFENINPINIKTSKIINCMFNGEVTNK